MRYYEYRHIVAFEETNLTGNVYYTNHVRWQGRCREMFLREHAPEILEFFADGFVLATISVSCEYLAELSAFNEVIVRMRLGAIKQNRIQMIFEYWKQTTAGEHLVARGEQQIACMLRKGNQVEPTAIPTSLREALRPYGGDDQFQTNFASKVHS
jgi:enediyne biosynthesis thioesterase